MPSLLSNIETVPVGDLTTYPGNPRKGNVQAIAESLRVNRQYAPVIAQKSTRHVLAGNHTLLAARQIGWPTIDVVFVDVDDVEARRIVLSSNRTADLGVYDDELLAELLSSIEQLDGTGYVDADIDRLLSSGPDPGSMGDQASSFLNDMLGGGAGDRPAGTGLGTASGQNGEAPSRADGAPASEYVPMTWLVTVTDRVMIRRALNKAMEQWGLLTSAEALGAVARDYLGEGL